MIIGKASLRDYQIEAHEATIENIRKMFREYKEYCGIIKPKPFIVTASVGAGKSILIGALASHVQSVGWKMMVISRQGEIIDQNSDALWLCDVKNSIYSASIGRKSTHYPVVCGTEGTIANDLMSKFVDWVPDVIAIDECHMLNVTDICSDQPSTQYSQIIRHFQRLNPRLVVVGYTGSPYRGVKSIIGDFWSESVYNISTAKLVDLGFLVPTVFGWPDENEQYHMEEFDSFDGIGCSDFSAEQLARMAKIATADRTLTQRIIMRVIELTRERNGVLITCASKRHCEQAAEFLPDGSWAIITDDTGYKTRKKVLTDAKNGKIKYLLQIGCLTTGFDAPIIDSSVLLRRIGSLTLLVQLLGRGMRILKPEQVESGIHKVDHLVLDYSGTMDAMGHLYADPVLDSAALDKAKKDNEDLIECPKCATLNAPMARRCMGRDSQSSDGRCEFFFSSKSCPHCGTENDQAAQVCRNQACRKELIDPNAKLSGTHYRDTDWKRCTGMNMVPTKNGGVAVTYFYQEEDGSHGKACLFFSPFASDGAKRIWQQQFVYRHISDWSFRGRAMAMKSAEDICKMKAMFAVPEAITHRKSEKGKDVVHGMKFSNRTLMGGKEVKNAED